MNHTRDRDQEAGPVEDFLRQAPDASYRQIYDALHSGIDRAAMHQLIARVSSWDAVAEWAREQTQLEILPVWGAHLAQVADRLAELGLDPRTVAAAACDTFEMNARIAEHLGADKIASLQRAAERKHTGGSATWGFFETLRRVQGGFSRLAAGLGYASTICPFTGTILQSRHAIPIAIDVTKQVCIFYFFRSVINFYVIVSSWSGGKEYIYIPSKNLLLRLHEPWFAWGEPNHMITEFMHLAVRRSARIADYYASATEPALLGNTMDNLGHFFWNDAAGFDAFAREGFLTERKRLICYRHNPIKISDLFDDIISPTDATFASDADDLLNKTIGNDLFVVRPCYYKIEPQLAERVKTYAQARVSGDQIQAAKAARTHGYVLWVNFRAHNKALVNLTDVIIKVADKLVDRYGSLAIFADGFSDCAPVLDALVARLPRQVALYPGLDLTISDSIHWASVVDSYIATIGSGLTIVTWIAGRPGIAHSEPAHLGQMEFWHQVRPDVPPPLTPAMTDIHAQGDAMYANYEIVPEVFLGLIEQLRQSPHHRQDT
ncbi:hypothetical protein [Methylobacterium radiotolerans]|uniref:hypothetical protein n=1 Tax=Methylobacterium radiotolerans TaxID=31998 RepID=UPI001F1AB82B|nr:hypothetical protein [Methylobacterium radiotolerans]UIY43234.1 hypothetical protein LZ599_05770 [Methylobacterium radiotolerans]